jgi:hypothetical protein
MKLDLVSPLGLDPLTKNVERADLGQPLPSSRVLLLDNGKWNVNHLFTGIEEAVALATSSSTRIKKPHYSRIMHWSDLEHVSGRFNWVITGVAD